MAVNPPGDGDGPSHGFQTHADSYGLYCEEPSRSDDRLPDEGWGPKQHIGLQRWLQDHDATMQSHGACVTQPQFLEMFTDSGVVPYARPRRARSRPQIGTSRLYHDFYCVVAHTNFLDTSLLSDLYPFESPTIITTSLDGTLSIRQTFTPPPNGTYSPVPPPSSSCYQRRLPRSYL